MKTVYEFSEIIKMEGSPLKILQLNTKFIICSI